MGALNNQKTILNAINYIKRNYNYSYIVDLQKIWYSILVNEKMLER